MSLSKLMKIPSDFHDKIQVDMNVSGMWIAHYLAIYQSTYPY